MDNFYEMPSGLSPMSKFVQRYIEIVERVSNQITVPKILNILEKKSELLERINKEATEGRPWPNDELTGFIQIRWNGNRKIQGWYTLWWNAHDLVRDEEAKMFFKVFNWTKLDSNILQYLGIKGWQHPEEILYDEKEEFPSQKFILYQDSRTGEYSRFYGSGKAQTRDQFIEELNQTYQGYDDFILKWISDVQISPAIIAVHYRGKTIKIQEV